MPNSKPTDKELYQIYLDEDLDSFCEFGGLSEEGKRRALNIWKRRQTEKKK